MRVMLVPAVFGVCLLIGCDASVPVEEISPAGSVAGAADAVIAAVLPPVDMNDWPCWRGAALDGNANGQDPPLHWSETDNIVWKADVPGRGHATPVLWGDQVFVVTALEEDESQRLLSYDRQAGSLLWNTVIHQGGFMHMHQKNSQASGTPACDGQRVFCAFMNEQDGKKGIWVTAVDLDGQIVWQTLAGPFATLHGYGSSPVLYRGLVIVCGDNGKSGFLAAINRETGDIYWRIKRERMFSFASPVVAEVAGRPQLLIHGTNLVTSYDPNTGKELWRADGPAQTCANTVAFDEKFVYASGGYPEKKLLAIRADGSGDVSATHVVWSAEKAVSYVPSMIVNDGRLFVVNDSGIATCYIAATGEVVWQKRLGGNFSASPVLAGGNLFVPDEDGKLVIIKAADAFERVGTNDLGDGGFATPVVAGGRIYLRTLHHLYCIGAEAGG